MGYDDEQDARVAADKISRLIVVIFFIVYSYAFALVGWKCGDFLFLTDNSFNDIPQY